MHRNRTHPKGRTLHLVDVENLAAESHLDRTTAAGLARTYRRTIRVEPDDHVVVGCDAHHGVDVGLAWAGAQLRIGHGHDGADHALLDHADPAFLADRYDRVVIASGDGIFAGLGWALRALGVAVCIVSRPESLSRHLRRVGLVLPLAVDLPYTTAA